MVVGIVTSFPPSKVTLNEYGYHLVKNFASNIRISKVIVFCDKTEEKKKLDFPYADKVVIEECWKFNSYKSLFTISKSIQKYNLDEVLFNLQFMKFGDKKVVAALGLFTPVLSRVFGVNTTVLTHNILETVNLKSAGFTSNKIVREIYSVVGYGLTKLLLCANKVVVTMPKYKRILEMKYKAKNVEVIPHGTFETPKKLFVNKNNNTKRILAFGKFGTYKKVEGLIEAVELVRKRIKADIEIVIAGTNNPNTPTYLEKIQKKYKNVKKLSFTGYVKEEDVQSVFGNSDIVVFPYTSTTGSSGVLHQAGSYGKAVILPNIGDLKELIKDEGYRGVFFDPNSVESLADSIIDLVTHKRKLKMLGKINYIAANAFPMYKICEMYVSLFNQKRLLPKLKYS